MVSVLGDLLGHDCIINMNVECTVAPSLGVRNDDDTHVP